jgi:hypothetical protein
MLRRLIQLFFLGVAIGFATAATAQSAIAQSTSVPPAQKSAQKPVPWPSNNYLHKVDLVTVSQPGIVRHCRVHAITDDAITCGNGMGRKPVVYQRDDVAALLAPRRRPRRDGIVTAAEIAGGSAGVAFAGPVAVVIVMSGCLGVLLLASGMVHL